MSRLFTLGLIVTGTLVLASISDADERRERAVRREAAELAEQGRTEESERVERETLKRMESAERERAEHRPRTDLDPVIEKNEAYLRDLRGKAERLRDSNAPKQERAELEERIARIERELDGLRAERKRQLTEGPRHHGEYRVPQHRDPHREDELRAAAERIEHAFIAAEHLDAAGMRDVARELRRNAEQMERELHHARRGHEEATPHRHDAPHELARQMEELRNEVRRLRDELNELREQVSNR